MHPPFCGYIRRCPVYIFNAISENSSWSFFAIEVAERIDTTRKIHAENDRLHEEIKNMQEELDQRKYDDQHAVKT